VLRRVAGARLLIGAVEDAQGQQRLAEALQQRGIAAERLLFRGLLPMQDYLALHQEVDLLLDSHPYPGGTTIHHGLWMGVPTVTRTGEALVSWQGAGILRRAGLGEFVAHDDAGYVALAALWAGQPAALAALRAGLRDRLCRSPLLQPATVAAGYQAALRVMWRRWCAGLPPASFEIGG
jgi:predicted O-linked N-acetylglucosamine transferase (SPINDLY family)